MNDNNAILDVCIFVAIHGFCGKSGHCTGWLINCHIYSPSIHGTCNENLACNFILTRWFMSDLTKWETTRPGYQTCRICYVKNWSGVLHCHISLLYSSNNVRFIFPCGSWRVPVFNNPLRLAITIKKMAISQVAIFWLTSPLFFIGANIVRNKCQ